MISLEWRPQTAPPSEPEAFSTSRKASPRGISDDVGMGQRDEKRSAPAAPRQHQKSVKHLT